MNNYASAKAPVHLWIVGVLSLFWNGYGCFDYVMSEMRNADYLAGFPPEMIDLLDQFPAWAVATWAIAVWASLAGAVLLLMRSRYAAPAFALSLVSALANFAYQMTLTLPPALDNVFTKALPLVVLIVIVLQWYYARAMTKRGVLR